MRHARALIDKRQYVYVLDSDWGESQPDADAQNTYLERHGGDDYAAYKDSTVRYQPVRAASVADGCLLGHASATLDVPAGPLQGTHRALLSILVVEDADTWKVRSLHNTLVTG